MHACGKPNKWSARTSYRDAKTQESRNDEEVLEIAELLPVGNAGDRGGGSRQRGQPGDPGPLEARVVHDPRTNDPRRQFAVLGRFCHLRHVGHQPLPALPNPQAARPQVDAERGRDHLSDLQDLPHSTGQIPADVVRHHRGGNLVLPLCFRHQTGAWPRVAYRRHPDHCPGALFRRGGHGWLVCGGLVRHPRQHLRQRPHGLRLAARRAVGRGQYPTALGHVGRPVPDFARTCDDGHYPARRAARDRRLLLPGLRHRRIAWRLGPAAPTS